MKKEPVLCARCQTLNPSDASYCKNCGRKVGKALVEEELAKIRAVYTEPQPSYLLLTLIATILCFPYGLLGVVFSLRVLRLNRRGEYYDAMLLGTQACECFFGAVLSFVFFLFIYLSCKPSGAKN